MIDLSKKKNEAIEVHQSNQEEDSVLLIDEFGVLNPKSLALDPTESTYECNKGEKEPITNIHSTPPLTGRLPSCFFFSSSSTDPPTAAVLRQASRNQTEPNNDDVIILHHGITSCTE